MKIKYGIEIYWSEIDRVYVAKVPQLKGCMAHGHSYEEAAKNIQEEIGLWIDEAMKEGTKLPHPYPL